MSRLCSIFWVFKMFCCVDHLGPSFAWLNDLTMTSRLESACCFNFYSFEDDAVVPLFSISARSVRSQRGQESGYNEWKSQQQAHSITMMTLTRPHRTFKNADDISKPWLEAGVEPGLKSISNDNRNFQIAPNFPSADVLRKLIFCFGIPDISFSFNIFKA